MRQDFVNTVYELMHELEHKPINNGFSFLTNPVPANFAQSGIYFFFDPAIQRANGGSKIIRIGITGDNNNNRLNRHRNNASGASAFRRHVERALSNLHHIPVTEHIINDYIHPLPYLFLPIPNLLDLIILEKRLIEIISNRNQNDFIDAPGATWLGNQQGLGINNAISQSHMWCVHYTGSYQPNNGQLYYNALNLLEDYITAL